MATHSFTNPFNRVTVTSNRESEGVLSTEDFGDVTVFMSAIYPLVDAGPLGDVRAVDRNTIILNDQQLEKLKKLQEDGVIPTAQISRTQDNMHLVHWGDESEDKK